VAQQHLAAAPQPGRQPRCRQVLAARDAAGWSRFPMLHSVTVSVATGRRTQTVLLRVIQWKPSSFIPHIDCVSARAFSTAKGFSYKRCAPNLGLYKSKPFLLLQQLQLSPLCTFYAQWMDIITSNALMSLLYSVCAWGIQPANKS
jgi:hypothetical protein